MTQMTHWYVKDLSRLTGVSVQTLHHYDRIDLLRPSERLLNGYRVYTKKDLLRLQQILALKFFGFELSHIKALLSNERNMSEHFSAQIQLLEQKANALMEASRALKEVMRDAETHDSISWATIIQLIEVYRMTKQLDHAWVKEIFTPDELKQYATFQKGLDHQEEKAIFEKNWSDLLDEINANIDKDPTSAMGIALAKRCMDLINGLYGKKYAHLRTKIFEQGFAQGKGLEEVSLTPESVTWLEKAMDAYWRDRFYRIFAQVGQAPSESLERLFYELLDDMYGEDTERKKDIFDMISEDDNISPEAKAWVRSLGGI